MRPTARRLTQPLIHTASETMGEAAVCVRCSSERDTWCSSDNGGEERSCAGDSYIVLNTAKKAANSEALVWDIYYWIGSKSTQDEYTAVAIKTVELDNWLDDAPVQHREVEVSCLIAPV